MEHKSTTTITNPMLDTVESLSKGNLPTNEQFTDVAERTQEFLKETQQDTSVPTETKKVLSDAQEVIEAVQELVENKNADEHLQKFAKASVIASKEATEGLDKEKIKEKIKEVDEHGELQAKGQELAQESLRAGQAFLEVAQTMVKSGEFRTWILDFVGLMHDVILNSSIQNTGASPMKSIQHTKPTRTGAPLVAGSPMTNEVQEIASSTTFGAHTKPIDFTWSKVTSSDQWKMEIPEETKHELAHRFITLLRRVNRNSDFSQSVQNFFKAMEDFQNEANRLFEEAKNSTEPPIQPTPQVSKQLQTAYDEAKQLIEEFSGRSLDQWINYMRDFVNKLRDNKELNSWRTDVRNLFRGVIKKPEMVDEVSLTRRIEDLIERGRQVFNNSQLRESFNKINDEAWTLIENIRDDPDIQNLNEKLQQFAENFTYTDKNGQRHFNTDLMGQMQEFITPLLIKQLENIPMPTLEGSNPDVDWRVENLVFSGTDVIPDHVHINFKSDIDFNVKKLAADKTYTRAVILIDNIHVKLNDVHFWFRKKTVPTLEDEGIASLECSGDKASLKILLKMSGGLERPSFKVSKVNCDIDKLSIDIKEAQHSFLLNIAKYFYEAKWKQEIERSVEERIKTVFNQIESGFSSVFEKYPPKQLPTFIKEQFSSISDPMGKEKKMDREKMFTTTETKGSPKTVSTKRTVPTAGYQRTSAH